MKFESWVTKPTLSFAGTAAAIVVTFRVADTGVARLAELPAAAYSEPFFIDNLVMRWASLITARVPWWAGVAAVVLAVGVFTLDARLFNGVVRQRVAAIFSGWAAIDDGLALRWLVFGITGVATWALSTYARNLYLDQLHLTDRLILVALWLAILWRPIVALPFAVVATAIGGQFVIPLGFISWTEMGVILRFPVLVGAFWIVRAATLERKSDVFVFTWCCIVAATYWTSGFGKLIVGWMAHPHINLLLLGAYANGWLAFLPHDSVERFARGVSAIATPLMFFTLLVECGSLVMLWRRSTLVAFFVFATVFHLGAFAMTGIFFWKWILVDLMLLVYLFRKLRLERLSIFTPPLFVLSVLVILASPLWTPSENLTWFDTPLSYSLEFDGIDASGNAHVLPAGFFRPYSDAIVLGPGGVMPSHPKLTRGMGVAMERGLASILETARSPEMVLAIENSRGALRNDSTASNAFVSFVARYAEHADCAANRDPLLLRIIGAPRHLWTSPLDADLPCGVRLDRVRVIERTSFFDGTSLRVIRTLALYDIPVSPRTRSSSR